MEEFCIKREDETLYLKGAGRLTSQNSEAFKNTVYSFLGESPCRNRQFKPARLTSAPVSRL
jgi:hypothetical protein